MKAHAGDHRRHRFARLALVAAAGLAAGCNAGAPPTATPGEYNLILISIDTLRPDHLGAYGYDRATSPELDALRADAVLFEQAIAHAPSTLPSHASILTSLLPHHHGASWETRTPLAEEVVTLAEVLASAGYRTAAFVGGGQVAPVFGLGQGFERYAQPASENFGRTVRAGLEWVRRHEGEPFFLFLHTYEPHTPYTPESTLLDLFETDYTGDLPRTTPLELVQEINGRQREIDDDDVQHIRNTYDAEIRSTDDELGRLVRALREMELYDRTMIVFTSDHGEEFGEHGQVAWHSHTLFDELLRVPLIIKFPGGRFAGDAEPRQVRGIDIAPTALAALGAPAPSQFSGVDLAAWRGRVGGEDLLAISRLDRVSGRRVSSVRTERFKLVRAFSPHEELFDLERDPGEQWDASVSNPDVVAELRGALQEALSSAEPAAAQEIEPDAETEAQLKALGYLD